MRFLRLLLCISTKNGGPISNKVSQEAENFDVLPFFDCQAGKRAV
jgi:hypothetical protein